MLQINNLHATVGDKPILKGFALSLCLAACSEAPAKSTDCAVLARQRQIDVSQVMNEFKATNPQLQAVNAKGNPSLKDGEKYLELQVKIERIENTFHAKCPESK
jgi:hypothetical protein